ncbi:hypothetical protein SSP24_04750 [Streptomyces spinoverrucosus]|uniref:DUF6777 domain-containing protein n=1 Tax=Streptomyces spinoverrucosus TaxID=284043 RepID=A0A4Y3VAI5_9ACTN|nr:hypothetical protein SSP24_04750 [Streptomyces spinoverrucosus]GHB40271.1 hypothetical protein GCM10010397_07840 [Streptomyces spinoverrucosus]
MVRVPTGTFVTACALSAALLAAGCGVGGDEGTKASGELFLQPVKDQGPDPFTDSTATSSATPTPVTRTPQSAPTAHSAPGVTAPATLTGVRTYSGWTPGLYGGRARSGSCDVDRQIRLLTADQGRAQAFAQASGVSRAAIPGYLRGLTSAELRADTRVTNHGYRDGRATGHQAVLQAGTAVLVDNRGVPRVRCACGNPLGAPVAMRGTPGNSGRAWPGYRPTEVIVVTPAPQAITNITLINVVNNTWIERPIGHDVRRDKVVPRPQSQSQSQPDRPSPSRSQPQPQVTESDGLPSDGASSAEGGEEAAPALEEPTTATATPVVESDAPLLTPEEGSTAPSLPGEPTLREPVEPLAPSVEVGPEIGPETVPESPDLPDGGGLIPDDPDASDDMGDTDASDTPDASDAPDTPETADSIFGSLTDVFAS